MSRKVNLYTHSNQKKKVSEEELYMMCEDIHHTPDDFIDGDLAERIEEYSEYELVEIDLDKDVDLDEWNICDETVSEYAEEIKEDISDLPISLISHSGSIIDGSHRLNALKKTGRKKTLAYRGIKRF